MKFHIKYSLITIILCLSITNLSYAKTYRYDTAHSEVGFSVSHMVVSTVHGHFNDVTAELFWNPKKLKKSYLNGTINVTSIDTNNKKRDNHLQAKEFFHSNEFPTITFKSSSIKANKNKKNTYILTGELTIKDITKSISCPLITKGPITDPWNNERIGFEATCSIKRMEFNINQNKLLKTGDLIIGNDIEIKITVEGIAKNN